MATIVSKFLANDKIRYIVAGGCTTLVNLITFFVLRGLTSIDRNICNIIAISMAIAFAYFANKYFVFKSKTEGKFKTISEAASFVGVRLISMGVEVLGFTILCDSFRLGEFVSKLFVQIIVLVLNYVFSNLFVFNKERKSFTEALKENYCYYVSFLIVLFLMLATCISQGITPFGNNSLTLVDSIHQYLPFLAELREKLLHEGSLFYTWNIAMGSNFMSLSAYYLNSPFNYLLLLFSEENLVIGINFILIIKICFSAATMSYYLSKKGGETKKDPYIIGIAVAYALSNYVIGYNWNLMWTDCLMIFPLIMLGFERLMKDNDPKLYTLSLFYCLYCNYYIGFMICIFMVFWFFVYSHPGVKAFFKDGIRFAIYSALGGGLAMFSLVPAYLGIMSTASADMKLPLWKWYGSIFQILKQQLFLTEPITNQTFDGGANLYCGMFAVFALFLYLFRLYKKPFERIKKVLLLIFLIMSCNNELLNYIWHGFHNQYGIPNRFTFLFIFVLLDIAFDVLRDMKDTKPFQVIFAGIYAVVYVILCKVQLGNGLNTNLIVYSVALIVIYSVWCFLRAGNHIKKQIFSYVFTFGCCVELVVNATFGLLENGHAVLDGKFDTTEEIAAAYDVVMEMAEEENAGFYRVELMDSTVLDEVTWHHLPSVGTFCSTVLGDMVTTMGRLGFYTGANEFLYMGSTPFTNSIFNVRYILGREGDYNNFDFDYVTTVDGIAIYENPYPLAIGFCVNEELIEWDRDGWRYENAQEKLAESMVGINGFFNSIMPELIVSSDDGNVSATGTQITFEPSEGGSASYFASFYASASGDYYLNCRGSSITKIRFYVDSEELTYDRYQSQIFHLGELEAGQYVTVEFYYKSVNAGNTYSATLSTSLFEQSVYENVYSALDDNMLDVEEYDDGYILGTVEMPENKVLFTSVPYDEGWTVKVDGEKVQYDKACGSFIAVRMEPGIHTVEMIYVPRGLYIGIAISVFSCAIFMLLLMYNKNKKNKEILAENDNNDIDQEVNI